MSPTTKGWLFGRVPVILFMLTAFVWLLYLTHSIATRPPYPAYPDIGGIFALLLFTIPTGVLAFLLAAFGLRSPTVSRRWAWAGFLLNAPMMLYLVGFYPATFVYKLFATP
jgi:hypothetical protein